MNTNGGRLRPAASQSSRPNTSFNQTLHIGNLPDKIHKKDVRRILSNLASTHGSVLDVVDQRTKQMRGQAHVVYCEPVVCSQALRALSGTGCLGKALRVQFATSKSHSVSVLDGSAPVPDKSRPRQTAPTPQAAVGATDLQRRIFAPAPGTTTTNGASTQIHLNAPNGQTSVPSPQGTKRPREDDSEASDEPMDEEDEGGDMDVSD